MKYLKKYIISFRLVNVSLVLSIYSSNLDFLLFLLSLSKLVSIVTILK